MKYLLIQSKSPWESGDVTYFYDLAHNLAAAGNEVTLFLVQNGVLGARKRAEDTGLSRLGDGVRILADDFSLKERGISVETLRDGIQDAPIETVVDLVAHGAKAIWH